jgi:hypothetical protein
MVPEMLVIFNQLTQLIAWEDSVNCYLLAKADFLKYSVSLIKNGSMENVQLCVTLVYPVNS